MKKNKYLIGLSGVIISLFCFWFFYLRNARENYLMRQGNILVLKIEEYQQKNKRLPNSLSDIGIQEKTESDPPLYFEKRDSAHFTISFGISIDDSKIYYSDSKKWEDSYREMK